MAAAQRRCIRALLIGSLVIGGGAFSSAVLNSAPASAGGNPTVLHTTSTSGPNVAVGNILTGVGSSTSSFGVACTSLATSATVESDPYEPGTAQLNVTDATFAGCTGPDNSPLTITEETYPITESISDAAGDPVTTGAQTVDVDSLAFGFDCQYSASGGSGSWSNRTNSATITGETYSTGGTGNTNLCPPSTVSSLVAAGHRRLVRHRASGGGGGVGPVDTHHFQPSFIGGIWRQLHARRHH